MHPIRTIRAAAAAPFESLSHLLSSHRAITRVSLAALSFTVILALNPQGTTTTQAGPERVPLIPESLLPQNIGVAVGTDVAVTIPFSAAVDPDSVESAVQVLPDQKLDLTWNDDRTELSISPQLRWRTDEHYLVVLGTSAETADGESIGGTRRFSFSTEPGPSVTDFQVRLVAAVVAAESTDGEIATELPSALSLDPVSTETDDGSQPPTRTARDVSATSSIEMSFSEPMDRADVEAHFSINPAVDGELDWREGNLVFSPSERLEPGSRYTISVIGSHNLDGNVLAGKNNFSFIVQTGAQLTQSQPEIDAGDVEPATVEMWFSQPMQIEATNDAFSLTDTATGALVGGLLNWNEAGTQLIYTPDTAFVGGRTFEVSLSDDARDVDGNPVTTTWSFSTRAAPVVAAPAQARGSTSTRSAAPAIPAPAPATSLAGHALNQINAARAAYGFAPLVLDPAISAVASAHAWDQLRNGYYSHTSLNGQSLSGRLSAGGVGFSAASENQCHYYGKGAQGTLDWCHSAFMSEPYPGQWNHIANVLNPQWGRVGVGIADNGSHVIITWDFTN